MVRSGSLIVGSRWPRGLLWLLCGHGAHLLHHLYLLDGCLYEFILAVLLKFSLNRRVPVILNVIVGSTGEVFGNVGPPVSVVFVHGDEYGFFVIGPFTLFELGIQVIDKSFATLFALAPGQKGRNFGPLASVHGPFFAENNVFFHGP